VADLVDGANASEGVGAVELNNAKEQMRVVPARRIGQWVSGAIAIALLALTVRAFATNDKIAWSAIPKYMFSGPILSGLWHTILLAVLAQGIGVVLGAIIAVTRMSTNPVSRSVSWLYIWVFRGTPLLVQLIFWFNLGLVFDRINLTIPGIDWIILRADTNSLITPFAAALLGLALNEGAYMAEIVRGGLIGVEPGQTEASQALGMSPALTLRRVVLPQAIRIIIPPTGNEFINMLKTTSLASVIAYADILTGAKQIYNRNLLTLELLMVASIWYIIATSLLSVNQFYLERHYSKGANGGQPASLLSVWWRAFRPSRTVAR
jgi:polar amino acid transport system permease protein